MFIHTNTPIYEELTSRNIAGKRWYTLPDGKKYPSVTTVLGSKEKPWLENWRQMLGPKKASKETKRCADRGTAIHKMAENYLNNNENPTNGFDQKNIYLFNQLKFCLNKINNIRVQEVPLYSHILKLAGRVDVIADYDEILSVIDFKTSTQNKLREEMVFDYFLQSTAYALMYYELFDEFIEDIVILITVEKGIMPLVYKRKIDNYIKPLVKRINTFYKKDSENDRI